MGMGDLIDKYPITESICKNLGPYEIRALRRTCSSAAESIPNKIIHIQLLEFLKQSFKYPHYIIEIMHTRKIVIGGSMAVSIVWPDVKGDSIWEFHVNNMDPTYDMITHLERREEMELISSSEYSPRLEPSRYARVFSFKHEKTDVQAKVIVPCLHKLSSIYTSPTSATKCFITSLCTYVLRPNLMHKRILMSEYIPLSKVASTVTNYQMVDADPQTIADMTNEEIRLYSKSGITCRNTAESTDDMHIVHGTLKDFEIDRIPHIISNDMQYTFSYVETRRGGVVSNFTVGDDWKYFSQEDILSFQCYCKK